MSRRDHRGRDKGRLGPFVPLLKETLQTVAWRAMSHGARSLYVSLRGRVANDCRNNGKVFLSQRAACLETGSGFEQIVRWFKELQHFGFIVQTRGGCLGSNGKGQAPHWRLTELGTPNAEGGMNIPTRDFLRWAGSRFNGNETTTIQKQNPATESRCTPLRKAVAPPLRKTVALSDRTATESRSIENPKTATESRSISSNHLHGEERSAGAKPPAVLQPCADDDDNKLVGIGEVLPRTRFIQKAKLPIGPSGIAGILVASSIGRSTNERGEA
jgi:hypothetical protein